MATVTIRIDDDSRDELEEIARTRDVTISDLLRDQISGLLGREVPERDETPHALSVQQRHLLAQQYEILAQLRDDEDEGQRDRTMAEILREGYAGEYGRVFLEMQAEMPRAECKLVWDVLDMFRILEVSIDRLPAADRAQLGQENERRLRFGGFDMNDSRESRMLGYVRYLVDDRRWEEIGPRLDQIGDRGNSHMRCLPSYERMLAVFAPMHEELTRGKRGFGRDALLLTADELGRVAEAWALPGRG